LNKNLHFFFDFKNLSSFLIPFKAILIISDAKLNIAIAGLGRMGARHALHFYNLTPRANLIAASSPDKKELVWANRNLEGVRTYKSYDEMLRVEKENGLRALVIASATTVHCRTGN